MITVIWGLLMPKNVSPSECLIQTSNLRIEKKRQNRSSNFEKKMEKPLIQNEFSDFRKTSDITKMS